MATHTQLIYHIVYSTKHREPTIDQEEKKRMFAFIHQLLTNKNCHLYRINGVEDHLHILTHVHPTIAISSLVKDIKSPLGVVYCLSVVRFRGRWV